jgi:hypothetical protein
VSIEQRGDERFHAGRYLLHILQALTISALVGLGSVLMDLNAAMHRLDNSTVVLTTEFAAFKDQYDHANIDQVKQDVTRLQDDQAYLERELNNYPPHLDASSGSGGRHSLAPRDDM